MNYKDPAGDPVRQFVTQADLGLAPIDLLFTIDEAATQAATALDDLVLTFISTNPDVRPDTRIELAFTEAEANKITFFEAAPLLASLRALALRSRPLEATDVQLPGEASAGKAGPIRLEKARIDAVRGALDGLKTPADNFLVAVQPDADGDVLTNLDAHLTQLGQLSAETSLFGLPHTGFATVWQNRADIYAAIRKKLTDVTERWAAQLDRVARHHRRIARAGRDGHPAIAGSRAFGFHRGLAARSDSAGFAHRSVGRQSPFELKLSALTNILAAAPDKLVPFQQQVETEFSSFAPFDPSEVSLSDQTGAMQTMLDQFVTCAQAIVAEAERRLKAADAKILAHDAAADPAQKVKLLQEAGKALLGDDFRMVPAFKVAIAAGSEWKNSHDASDSLLTYLTSRPENPLPLPIDEWLHGAARVREKMFHFENVMLLNGAFGQDEPALRPVQLPFRAGEDWLALEFDSANPANTLETERLLYTAHYAEAFQPTEWQCGLLVDEWTEVIPQKEEVTGLAFHFDRPNAEPPQAWLLATPAAFTGEWAWDDLVASLNQTLDDARARAVEPDKLGKKFAALLPAVLTETSWSPMTISANLLARAAKDFSTMQFINPP